MTQLVKVVTSGMIRVDCVADGNLSLKLNEWCIFRTPRYEDYGRITYMGQFDGEPDPEEVPQIKRHASLVDQGKVNENAARAKSLHRKTDQLIKKHKLPMSLVHTHLTYDRRLAIFMFLAPGRVDFRLLLKDMNQDIPMRVELRQIGPRDQAGMVGGIGSCGRPLCCSSFLTNFVSINVKMAKTQNLSLNPNNIIGACGRLKCCLDYEFEGYKELLKTMPKIGSPCRCEGYVGEVIDRNLLKQTVTVLLPDERMIEKTVKEINDEKAEREGQRAAEAEPVTEFDSEENYDPTDDELHLEREHF